MKKFFLFGASILLLTGCQVYHTAGTGDYGYTYDEPLPVVSGTQAQLTAAINETPSSEYAAVEPGAQSHAPGSQSVVFYEGAQPSRGVVAAGTPVWTSPVAPTPAPAYIPGAPIVNEPAGAAAGNVSVGAAPMAGGVPYYYGDAGSLFIGGTNGVIITNVINVPTNAFTNIVRTNQFTTNTTVMTNGNNILTSNVVTSNMVATTPANASGTPAAPVGGATNNLNNLPRAAAPPVGTPPGTALVPNRPLGQPAGTQISPSPNIPAGSVNPTMPTQPGTVNEAAGAATTGTGSTGTQTSTPQNTTLGPQNTQTSVQAATPQQGVVNSGNPAPTGVQQTTIRPGSRVILTPRQPRPQQAAPTSP